MDATNIKLLFKANSPTQLAQRSLMIRTPEKMKVRTFEGDSLVWPTLQKKHQVLLLGPPREESGKQVMTDDDARSIFQKIGYEREHIYRTPKGGMVVFVQDFHPRLVVQKQQQKEPQKQQQKEPQKQKTVLISPIPRSHSGKRSSSSRPRTPSTPLLTRQLYS